ncbi:MAG TPA: hypothetical protein V6C71_22460 [Coleofasciculaceae cyanobacterium]|jgi:hypothetical protein
MTELSRSDFQTLAQENSTCVSIYMPAEKAGAETRQNPIRFKNSIREAEEKIAHLNKSTSKLNDALASAKAYIDNYDFWQHQDYGLAFFIGRDGVKYYRLPHSFEESVEVSDRFYLKPLLPVLTNDNKFYLLALSQNEVRFFLGSHYNIKEIMLPEGVPASLAEALKYDDLEQQLQYHGGGSGNHTYHGQGSGTTDNKDEIKRFFDQIDNGLTSVLQAEKTPLILAGVEYLLPIYHQANSYGSLLEPGIIGNPENIDPEDLHQQAWSIIEPHLMAAKQSAMDRYHQLSGTGEASSQLEEIVAGAANGQVDTLFIVENADHWGQFDRQTNQVEIHSQATEDSMDLLDFAVTQTYLQGGNVYTWERSQMPDNQSAIAIFRYPVYAQPTKATA